MTGCQALGGRAQDVQADQAQHQRDVQGGAPDAGSAQVSDPMGRPGAHHLERVAADGHGGSTCPAGSASDDQHRKTGS